MKIRALKTTKSVVYFAFCDFKYMLQVKKNFHKKKHKSLSNQIKLELQFEKKPKKKEVFN
jgi:hypothetical protein